MLFLHRLQKHMCIMVLQHAWPMTTAEVLAICMYGNSEIGSGVILGHDMLLHLPPCPH